MAGTLNGTHESRWKIAIAVTLFARAWSPSPREHSSSQSGEDFIDNVPVNVGQPTVAAVVAEGQLFMINPQQV